MNRFDDITKWSKAAWARLTQREQAALLLMSAACLAFAFYLLIALPALAYKSAAERSLANEGARLGRIIAMLNQADGGQSDKIDRSKPPRTRVVETARKVGILIDQVEPQADGFTVYARNIAAGTLFEFIAQVENRHGVPVINATINKAIGSASLDAEITFGDVR